jgi:TrmH family RNA methyltransferase
MAEINVFSKNAAYQKFEVLKTNRNKRYKYNEFWVEGVRSLNEAVKNGWKIKSFLFDRNHLSGWAKDMIRQTPTEVNYCLTADLMRDLSGKEDTSELMAVIEMRRDNLDEIQLSKTPFLVLFDRPSNRGNLGTMIRSCDALGADALLITGHAVDLYDPDVVVSAMGSFFNLPVIRVEDNNELFAYIEHLRQQYPGFSLLGTTAHKELPVYNADLTVPLMLMMGNETMGLNKAFKEACDVLCTIPMAEDSYASSFNVSCAASILMYEITRQRGGSV